MSNFQLAAPWIFNWIAISKDEKAATQTGWPHLWKRVITLIFAFYGMLFAIYISENGIELPLNPDTGQPDGELAWGIVMKRIIPAGYGTIGLLITSFFAAAMSLLSFSGIPIYFALFTKKSNKVGIWMSLVAGIASYMVIFSMPYGEGAFFADKDTAFVWGVFLPTSLSILGMLAGIYFGKQDDELNTRRFHVILNTPVGAEQRLVDAGIVLPSLIDNELVAPDQEEKIDIEKINALYEADSKDKFFNCLEIRREPTLPWYFPGFIKITLSCFALIGFTWLLRFLFI